MVPFDFVRRRTAAVAEGLLVALIAAIAVGALTLVSAVWLKLLACLGWEVIG